MNHKDHVVIDYTVLRHTFFEVHRWLDATYSETEKSGVSQYRHWITRHNVDALKNRYGDQNPEFHAGCLHILCDWLYHLDIWYLPIDEAEVVAKLKEKGVY